MLRRLVWQLEGCTFFRNFGTKSK